MQAARGLTSQRRVSGEVRAVRRRWHAPQCGGGPPTKPKPRIVYRCGAATIVRACGHRTDCTRAWQGSGVEDTVQCAEAVRGLCSVSRKELNAPSLAALLLSQDHTAPADAQQRLTLALAAPSGATRASPAPHPRLFHTTRAACEG